MSSCPTTSWRDFGRYFSTQISFISAPTPACIRGARNKPLAGPPNLSDDEVEELGDRADGIDQGRRETAREQQSDRTSLVVHDEGSAVSALGEDVGDDLAAEDRALPAVVDFDDRVDSRHT